MNDEKIEIKVTNSGQKLDVVVLNKRLDVITVVLGEGVHSVRCDLTLNRNQTGTERWTVVWVDDPVDNPGGDPDPNDYKRATVVIAWQQGALPDSIRMSRSFLGP